MAYQACLRKTVPVCGRNDSVCPNSILLLPDKATTFGRVISAETDVRLLSKSTPLMISRRHATISVLAGKWTIVDHEVKRARFGRFVVTLWPKALFKALAEATAYFSRSFMRYIYNFSLQGVVIYPTLKLPLFFLQVEFVDVFCR